jgi:hypothetical protein
MRHLLIAVLLLSLLAALVRGQSAPPQLTQTVVAGGGGASTQAPVRLDGTIGQGVVGTSSGGLFSLDAGFYLSTNNRPPLNNVPGAQATNEDTALIFGVGNAVSISDPDAGSTASVRVTLTAVNGTFSLGSTTGLTFTPANASNDGTNDAQAVFTGTLGDINAALVGLTFNPHANFNGAASLTLQTDDLGQHGEGGNQFDTDAVNINVNAVNDQPMADSQSLTTNEETPLGFTLTGSDTETAAASLIYTVTVPPAHGTLSGTAPNLTYTPADGYAGPDSLKFTVTDGGDGSAATSTSAEATVSFNVAALPDISVRDARVAEPTTGTKLMLFTVVLERAATNTVSVDFNTSSASPAPGVAEADSDYDPSGGTLIFLPGQRMQTIAVKVMRDDTVEPDETFLLELSNASGGRIADATATGTITQSTTPSRLLISELRTSGPAGAADDFVELYNNTDSPLTVSASDASGGYGVFKIGGDCNAMPSLVAVIPNGTVIPPRGHYLLVGTDYSLADTGGTGAATGDQTLPDDIENDANLAVFDTADVANLSALTRLDAVGFGAKVGNNCNLLREGNSLGAASGSTLEYSYHRKLCDFVQGQNCQTPGTPKDTDNNASDFTFADTLGTELVGTGQRLGAPGPENLASPLKNSLVSNQDLDSSALSSAQPNRLRDTTANPANNSTFGTLSLRRRVVNNTGGNVTRLRFRIIEITTLPAPTGFADIRALTSTNISVTNVNDPATCGNSPTPCTVTVQGTTLEQPPGQPNGGGLNATLAVGTVTLATPLAPGTSVNLHFLLGVQRTGLFRFLVVTEALP